VFVTVGIVASMASIGSVQTRHATPAGSVRSSYDGALNDESTRPSVEHERAPTARRAETKASSSAPTVPATSASVVAAEEGGGLTGVGRWMSVEEHGAIAESGIMQPGRTGVSNVAHPADVEAYMRQAAPGSRYVEFDVPESSLVRGGKEGWATIPGPDSIFSRLNVQRGLAPYEFPPAQNIEWIASRLWRW
jgi:hypothetical protein